MRNLLWAAALALVACESPPPPLTSLRVPSSTGIFGTGRNDLWWWESEAGNDPQRGLLNHHTDGADQKFQLDVDFRDLRAVASAEPGSIWVFSGPETDRLVARKLDPTGTVLVDRSADFEVLTMGHSYGSDASALAHAGAVALSISTSLGTRFFRFDGTRFVLLTPPAALGGMDLLAVRGLDDLWFARMGALVHYREGVWKELPGSIPHRAPSFDEDGVGWTLSTGSYEVETGTPRRIVVPIQRVENDEVQALRLEATTMQDSGFVLSGIVARPGGKFALLGHIRDVTPETAELSVLARGGDSSGLVKTDTLLHTCPRGCSPTTLMNVLDDGSFVLGLGAIAPGFKLVLIGDQSNLP